jgi:hypothetical protein
MPRRLWSGFKAVLIGGVSLCPKGSAQTPWKARYQAAEKSKAKELEDLRNMMESQRKSMIDR